MRHFVRTGDGGMVICENGVLTIIPAGFDNMRKEGVGQRDQAVNQLGLIPVLQIGNGFLRIDDDVIAHPPKIVPLWMRFYQFLRKTVRNLRIEEIDRPKDYKLMVVVVAAGQSLVSLTNLTNGLPL